MRDCDTYGMSSLFSYLWQHCSKDTAAKGLATSGTWKRYPNEHAADPGFVWANSIPQPNNAAILRSILQPVLKSMQDFQKRFDFPKEVKTFEQGTLAPNTL